MGEAIVWDNSADSREINDQHMVYSVRGGVDGCGVEVTILPNRIRSHNETNPYTKCDLILVGVRPEDRGRQVYLDPTRPEPAYIKSEYEITATEPPRGQAEFDDLAQRVAIAAAAAARITFAAFQS